MSSQITYEELVRKVQQQEDTVAQLVRIIATTNHRLAEIQIKQESMKNENVSTK